MKRIKRGLFASFATEFVPAELGQLLIGTTRLRKVFLSYTSRQAKEAPILFTRAAFISLAVSFHSASVQVTNLVQVLSYVSHKG